MGWRVSSTSSNHLTAGNGLGAFSRRLQRVSMPALGKSDPSDWKLHQHRLTPPLQTRGIIAGLQPTFGRWALLDGLLDKAVGYSVSADKGPRDQGPDSRVVRHLRLPCMGEQS